jgi:L-aspartate oxidase
MRGEGGMLKNSKGQRFMDGYHSARELAPRDVVTRAIHSEMALTNADHVYLDMTHLNSDYIIRRFPRIYTTCKELGIDISREPIPVSPAAHYIMGGVKTDLWGATTVPGLFAAGETACTGVHGANRLASNSLLEGLVYGERAGLAAARYARKRIQHAQPRLNLPGHHKRTASATSGSSAPAEIRLSLKKLMWSNVGIVRNKKELIAALKQLKEWGRAMKDHGPDRNFFELNNMITTASLITRSALLREGSVGAHFRSDLPTKSKNWRKRIVLAK